MERLADHNKRSGFTVNALRTWGMIFLAAGVIGRGVIQNHLLGFAGMSMQQMLDVLNSSATAMNYMTLSIGLQALETCAAPIFAVLLVEGILHTSDFIKYFTRVLGLALITEIPYNLAMGKGILDFGSRNPVFSLVFGMLLIFFYQRYSTRGFKNAMIKVIVTAAALLWMNMLKVDSGAPVIIILVALWALRKKPLYRNFAGASAAIVGTLFSPFFLAAPMSFLTIHMCNWERDEDNRIVNYLMYPGMLLLAAAVGAFLL